MTEDQFEQILEAYAAAWPDARAHPGTLTLAEHLLADLEYPAAQAAVVALAIESPARAPGLGAVRARAVRLSDPNPPPDAGEAWDEVRRAISTVGHIGRPEWSHPAIAAAVDALGGWRDVCLSETAMADRAHFLRIYESTVTRRREVRQLPPAVVAVLEQAKALTLSTKELDA